MKKGTLLIGLCLSSLALNASAAMSPTMKTSLVAVCKATTKDSVLQFKRTLKEHRINETLIFPKLICNGQSLHDFALMQGSKKVAEKIARYTNDQELNQATAMNESNRHVYSVTF